MVSFHNPIGKLLPADVSAANFRVPNRRILGGEILRGDMFKEELAEGLSLRLKQSMRAVDVFVPPKRCAGGVIQLGEHVNVNLTMTITDADGKKINRTAEIARDCRVIIVSGDISNRMTLDPEVSKSFTLEANPYRAALIDFAQHNGVISLTPVYGRGCDIR